MTQKKGAYRLFDQLIATHKLKNDAALARHPGPFACHLQDAQRRLAGRRVDDAGDPRHVRHADQGHPRTGRGGLGMSLDIDAFMTDVQQFASTWSLVGGKLDNGTLLQLAESQKAAIREELVRQQAIDAAIEHLDMLLREFRGAVAMPIGQARIRHWATLDANMTKALAHLGAPVAAQEVPAAITHVPA